MGYTVSGSPPPLWRAVRSYPPTEADFLSHKARGLPKRRGPDELWEGVSTFDSFEVASDMARKYHQGDFLSRLAIEPDGPIRWRATGGKGHYTLWGTPAELLDCVVETVPVPPATGGGQQ